VTTNPEFVISIPGDSVFLIIIAITVVSAVLMAWFFRRKGWL
jgi:Mg2+ and Co2+ transporter CorA